MDFYMQISALLNINDRCIRLELRPQANITFDKNYFQNNEINEKYANMPEKKQHNQQTMTNNEMTKDEKERERERTSEKKNHTL